MADIVQNSANPIVMANAQGAIVMCNHSFARLTGYSEKELLGLNWTHDLTPVEWHDKDEKVLEQLRNMECQQVRYEKQYLRKDGTRVFVELLVQPANFMAEAGPFYYAFASDTTERKLAEQTLQYQLGLDGLIGSISSRFINVNNDWESIDHEINLALQRTGHFVRASRVYIFMFAASGREVSATHEWCAPGYSPRKHELQKLPVDDYAWWTGQLYRREHFQVHSAKDLPDEAETEKKILTQGNIQALLVLPLVYKNKTKGCMVFEGAAGKNEWNQQQVAMLRIIAETIVNTLERKRAEDISSMSADIIQNISDGIAILNSKNKVTWVNPALVEMSGYTREELLNKKNILHLMKLDYPTQRKINAALQKDFYWEGAVRAFRKNRDQIYAILSITATRDKHGQLRRRFVVIRDVTEFVRLEKAQQKLHEQTATAQRLASLSRMSAGVVHEIAQPLNAIKVMVDGILYLHKNNYPYEMAEIMEKLREVSAETNRIDDIVRHMRSFANVGERTGMFPCSLNEAVNRPLHLLGRQIAAHGISVKSELTEDLPKVWGNNNRFEEAVINLLVNAMQALDAVDKPDKEIICTTYCQNDMAVLEVSDNADGIDEEIKDKIFEAFITTKPGGQGMGLGLSIVQSIVAGFNGEVEALNNSKGGATFRLVFPIIKADGEVGQ
jgi:PAS domain S-box-containing protein